MRRKDLSAILGWGMASLPLVAVALPHGVWPPPHPDHPGIATVTAAYSCEDAIQIKFDRPAYTALASTSRVLVDAQVQKCGLVQEQMAATSEHPAPENTVVVFANPAATSDYSGVSCRGLKDAVAASDLMIFVGPNAIVAQAKSHKLDFDVLRGVPLTSDKNRIAMATILDGPYSSTEPTANKDPEKVTTPVVKVVVNEMGSVISTPAGKVSIPHPRVKVPVQKN
jgi:hypothetical protein